MRRDPLKKEEEEIIEMWKHPDTGHKYRKIAPPVLCGFDPFVLVRWKIFPRDPI